MAINNKGITTVEVLLCFILIAVIATSLYSTISAFNERRVEEINRSKIINYTNVLTKTIEDDFIYNGLAFANITETKSPDDTMIYEVNCTLNDGTKRRLRIKQRFTLSQIHLDGNPNLDDFFSIEYGSPNKMESYNLPDLGYVKGEYKTDVTNMKTFVPCPQDNNSHCKKLYNLQINNVLIDISNEDKNNEVDSHVLSIFIGLYHPDLGNRYAINIISPINYQLNSSKSSSVVNLFDDVS